MTAAAARSASLQAPRFAPADCALCGGASRRELYAFDFDGEDSAVVECADCGLAYSSPRPRPEALSEFYGAGYYSYAPPRLPDPAVRASGKERLRRAILQRHLGYPASGGEAASPLPAPATAALARFMAIPRFRPGGRLLDVGCGSGERMLEYASFGWEVAGLEFSAEAAAAGRKAGLDIRTTGIEDAPFTPASFDCVTFYHSLEHVYDPAAALAAAWRLLKPGGELLVAVPNFACSERRLFGRNWGWLQMPTHLFHFDREHLRAFVERAGFTEIAVRPNFHGYSVDGALFGRMRRPAELALKLYAVSAAVVGDGKAITLTASKPGADA